MPCAFPFSALWWSFNKAQRDHFVSWLPWALWQQSELCVEDHSTRGSWDSSTYTCYLLVIIMFKTVFPDAKAWKDHYLIHFSISLMILTMEFIANLFIHAVLKSCKIYKNCKRYTWSFLLRRKSPKCVISIGQWLFVSQKK